MLNSVYVFSDVFTAWQHGAIIAPESGDPAGLKLGLGQDVVAAQTGTVHPQGEVMRFANEKTVPLWLAAAYMASNITLNILNIYWLGKMVSTIRKRFDPPFGTKGQEEKETGGLAKKNDDQDGATTVQRGVYDSGRKTVEIESKEVRSRRRG